VIDVGIAWWNLTDPTQDGNADHLVREEAGGRRVVGSFFRRGRISSTPSRLTRAAH
jgi:hypothetical protein